MNLPHISTFLPSHQPDRLHTMTPEQAYANGGHLIIAGALRLQAWEDYDEYLKTNHWQDVRRMAFQAHGWRCTIGVNCSALGPLHVHHRTYDNLGDEKPEDVEILCAKHHKMKHEAERAFVRAQMAAHFNRTAE